MTAPARLIATAALAAVGAAVFAGLGRLLSGDTDGMAPLWLANVAVLAPLLRFPALDRRAAVAGAALGLAGANLATGTAPPMALLLMTANVVEIVLGLALFERFRRRDAALHAPHNLAVFFLGPGLLAPMVAAAIGGGGVALANGVAPGAIALHWFAADALGMIVVGPLIVAAGCVDCVALWRSPRRAEIAGALLAAAGVTLAVFAQHRYPALFLILPVLVVAIFRLRFLGAASGVIAVALVASWQTVHGAGPIAHALADMGERILFLQTFLAVVVVANFPVAAVLVERAGMMQRLIDAGRHFRRMAESAPVAMFRVDAEGRLTFGNARWRELAGTRDGVPWHELVVPERRAEALAAWREAATAAAVLNGDFDLLRRGGASGRVALALSPERDADGRIAAWTGIASDVEEQRRAESAMAESERQYRLLADNSNDMIVRIGLDGVRRFVSPACRAILGFEPDELVGATPVAAIHAEDRARVERVCRSLLEGAVDPTCAYRQRRRDGSYAWLEATYRLVRNAAGVPVEFIASVRDVSRRRSAELATAATAARLEESNRLLSMAERLAGIGHWRLDAVTHDLFWSDEVFHIHGRTVGDIPPLAEAIEVYHPDDRAMVSRYVDVALAAGTPWTCRARLVRPDGGVRHVESSGQPERAPDGTIVGIVGVFRDITGEVEAAAALIAARDEATASAEAKSAFLATMSHEIRTPMTGVLGMIELLRADLPPEDRTRFFDNLEQSATLLMTVLDDVLDFSKIESGSVVLEQLDFDLGDLARKTVDLFHHEASRKGLLLSLAAPVGTDTMVRGDAVRLQQVMSNLISNAIKFTAAGRVELRIELSPRDGRRQVRIAVVDTGVGIPAGATGRLFEPFIQADASTTRRFGGTGLGLAISRRLVEAMGGEIGVDSVVGRGTTFHVTLTLDAGTSAAVVRPAPAGVAPRPLSLLLAEDNPINRALVEALVRRDGHRIRSVENGRLAVEAAAREAFDAILMDMQMPELDGLAATRAIREGGGPCAAVPIIALTADASAERRRFYDNAGLTDFMTKPIDSALLSRRLHAIAAGGPGPAAAPPATAPDDVLLDMAMLTGLEQAIGPAATDQLIAMLHDELEHRPRLIAQLIARGDTAGILAESHALKGATLNVGAVRVSVLARRIELDSAAGAPLDALAGELLAAAQATCQAIAARSDRRRCA